MPDEIYNGIPESVISCPDDLGPYAAYLEQEKSLTTFGSRPLDRVDNIQDMKALVREPQLTAAMRTGILTAIGRGAYPEVAAGTMGVRTATWRKWMEYANQGLDPWVDFLTEIIIAEAQLETACSDTLRNDPQHAKFLLERRFSRQSMAENPVAKGPRWRKQTNTELTVVTDGEEMKFSVMKPAQRAKALQQLSNQIKAANALEAADLGPEIPGEEGI